MRHATLLLLLGLLGCGGAPHEVVGPFTGTTYRFAVDQLLLPQQRSDYADDLNGDGRVDDQLGNVAGALAGQKDLTTSIDDMLGSGALTPIVEITTDDPTLRNDPTVGVRFIGRDGEPGGLMGAVLSDGVLTSNRAAATRAPVKATLHVPLFEHADPVTVPAIGLQIELLADGSGFGGTMQGAFAATDYIEPAWRGLAQMVAANPGEFPVLLQTTDKDHDGAISLDEFQHDGLIQNTMAPDVQLTDGRGNWSPSRDNRVKDSLSFGLWLHLTPCPSGACHAPPQNLCADRALDGDESDVDCGGSCLQCAGGARCNGDADCQSHACVAGVCAAPSCSDGVRNGYESDVDCGGYRCAPCAVGATCVTSADCQTLNCDGTSVCAATQCTDGFNDAGETDVDCGGGCPACAKGKLCNQDRDCQSAKCVFTCTTSSCVGRCG